MQAVVLVGGEGTRLRPLTYRTPKPMVPIFNVPFLERTLIRLREAGIDDVILPAGYLPSAITEHFGDGSRLGMRLRYVIEEEPLGTAGALKNIEGLITGTFFVLNGDVLTSLDLRRMLDVHREKRGIGVLHLIRVDDPSSFGCVVHDRDGRVTRFVEKPPPGTAPTNEVNAGTYLLERRVLDAIPAGRNVSIERETFPRLIAGPDPLYAYTTDDYWIDLGRPEHYLQSHHDVLAGKLTLPLGGKLIGSIGRSSALSSGNGDGSIVPPCFLGERVVIEPGAQVGPNAVVGDDVVVGSGARVRGSVLWSGVRIEPEAEVDGAIVASNATIGRGSRVLRGAVIGHDAFVAPNSVVAENARVSVDASVRI